MIYSLAEITVDAEHVAPALPDEFGSLRTTRRWSPNGTGSPRSCEQPGQDGRFVAEMDMDTSGTDSGAAVLYVCPMHPEVTSTEPARCPDCGMKLLPAPLIGSTTAHADHHDHAAHNSPTPPTAPDRHLSHRQAGEGIEWEDDMVEVNRMTTPLNMRWMLSTGTPARGTTGSTGDSGSAIR